MEQQGDDQQRERIAQLGMACICSNLRRAARAVTNYYDGILRSLYGLRFSQFVVLVVLYLAGPQTINELAELLALDRTTLTSNLKPLAREGLLALAPGDDHRQRIATLTPQGEQTVLDALPHWEQAQAHMVAGMVPEQMSAFLAQLSQMVARTQEP
jgi:DNA-binding MarR family transcriptional regulator